MHKTIGIVGLGRIGTLVGKIAHKGFDMNIIYYDVKRDKSFEKKFKAKYAKLNDLLKQSDFVSIHVPLIPATRHLISKKIIWKRCG